jgi:iron complex transport system substrate-binding protein
VLGRARERSYPTTWEAVAAAEPEVVVLAPCGFDVERTVRESGGVPALGARVVAVDGDAAYSRPGPRVAEGVAQLAHLLHPDAVPAPSLPSRELIPA